MDISFPFDLDGNELSILSQAISTELYLMVDKIVERSGAYLTETGLRQKLNALDEHPPATTPSSKGVTTTNLSTKVTGMSKASRLHRKQQILSEMQTMLKQEQDRKEANSVKMRQERELNEARTRTLRNTQQLYDIVFILLLISLFTRH